MARVKLGISGLAIPDKIQVCAEIVSDMTGNAAFASPVPKLTDIGDTLTKLSNSYQAALNGDRKLKAEMHLVEKILNGQMVTLSAYVQAASNGDEAIILSSGMQVVKRVSSKEPLATPLNLRCLHTDMEGESPMKCKPVRRSKVYLFQVSQTPDDPVSWKLAGSNTKAKFTATGLIAGAVYWFRVCASGSNGNSAWSDPAKRSIS